MNSDSPVNRRRVLQLSGTALAGAASAGCLGRDVPGGSQSTQLELDGKAGGWIGRSPGEIEGRTNPTLPLEAGTTYDLTWENLDGVEHELIVEDANGKELKASDSASKKGATVSLSFEATEAMAQYYCEYHPKAMRGDVGT